MPIGVTSTWSAGEYYPERVIAQLHRIDAGESIDGSQGGFRFRNRPLVISFDASLPTHRSGIDRHHATGGNPSAETENRE